MYFIPLDCLLNKNKNISNGNNIIHCHLPTQIVPLIFWGLYAVDRELIFPASMDAWFPGWLNHLMHTLPFFASIIEIVVTNHVYPKGRMLYFPVAIGVVLYLAW